MPADDLATLFSDAFGRLETRLDRIDGKLERLGETKADRGRVHQLSNDISRVEGVVQTIGRFSDDLRRMEASQEEMGRRLATIEASLLAERQTRAAVEADREQTVKAKAKRFTFGEKVFGIAIACCFFLLSVLSIIGVHG